LKIKRFDPFAVVGTSLFDDLNRLFEPTDTVAPYWTPRVDLADSGDAIVVRVELAGIDPADIEITVENDTLTIKGTRSFETAAEEGTSERATPNYRRREIFEGSFSRNIALSFDVDIDEVTATSDNGILEVTVPKLAAEMPRRVTVDVQR